MGEFIGFLFAAIAAWLIAPLSLSTAGTSVSARAQRQALEAVAEYNRMNAMRPTPIEHKEGK